MNGSFRQKQMIFARYGVLLTDYLSGRGVQAESAGMEGLNENGQPDGWCGSEERNHGMIRLRANEKAVSAFRLAGGWFAIPENGSLLRYIQPSPDERLMAFLSLDALPVLHKTVLAAAVSGNDAWLLMNDGNVVSSRPDAVEMRLFTIRDRLLALARQYFTDEDMEKAKQELLRPGGIVRLHGSVWHCDYATDAKVFFCVFADGNYYHGYEVSYLVKPKEDVLDSFAKYEDVISAELGCIKGKIPRIAVVDRLEDSGNMNYQPSDGYSSGIDFL